MNDPTLSQPQAVSDAAKPTVVSRQFRQGVVVAVLVVLVAIAALPAYLGGQWPWNTPLEAPHLSQVRALRETPLTLPGWNPLRHEEITLSGNRWGLTTYEPAIAEATSFPQITLMLRPQPWHPDQPEVEWMDLKGTQGWRTTEERSIQFEAATPADTTVTVTARYFKARTEQRTLAVVQWYAWPSGGHPSPGRWFWADQKTQWRHHERLPWTAVCILLPIEPTSDLLTHTEAVQSIAEAVQTALMAGPFQVASSE